MYCNPKKTSAAVLRVVARRNELPPYFVVFNKLNGIGMLGRQPPCHLDTNDSHFRYIFTAVLLFAEVEATQY